MSRRSLRLLPVLVLALFGLLAGASAARAAKCPNLVIVLDRSGSMTSAPDGGFASPPNRRWDIAVDAVKAIAKEYNNLLPIGLSMFAPDGGCGGGKLDVPPDYDTESKILTALAAAQPDSATPTGETIVNMAKEPALRDPSRGQYMILITDGEPNCSAGEPTFTVNALKAAYAQSPSITTFVVGFGALPADAANTMDQMAEAGGKPIMNAARKFYVAEDANSLKRALADIFKIIVGAEVAMGCDDTCYSNGCADPAQQCIRGVCKVNPCAGVICGPGRYCYTDGVSAGSCVAACTRRCRDGSRCEKGQCIPTDCPAPCIAGFVCNPDSKKCELDPLCPENRPVRQQCKSPSRCQGGTCIDDPCLFIKCPADTRCVAWNGSCEYSGAAATPDMGAIDPDLPGTNGSRGGCSSSPGAAGGSSLVGGLFALCVLLALRRRQRVG